MGQGSEYLVTKNKMSKDWLPIKTAPKNNEKRVMLYGNMKSKWTTATYHKHIHIGFYEPSKLYPKFDWVIMSFGKIDLRLKATHWRPLPNKPKRK